MADLTRGQRLQQRFNSIRESLKKVYGEEEAFAATVAAWLMAIQHLAYEAHKAAARHEYTPDELRDELEQQLRSLHQEICEHLGVDYQEAVTIAASFHEVIIDICNQKG